MAQSVPLEQFILDTVNAAPNGKITHAELAAKLYAAGYKGWGGILQQMHNTKQIGGGVTVTDGVGQLTYTPKQGR